MAAVMWWKKNSKRGSTPIEGFDPKTAKFNLWLVVSVPLYSWSFISSILGIGGGIIHVPMMMFILGFPTIIATATSTFVLMISALIGTVSHAMLGHILWSRRSRSVSALLSVPDRREAREEEQAETDPEAPLSRDVPRWHSADRPRDLTDRTSVRSHPEALPGFPGFFIRLPEVIYINFPFRAAHTRTTPAEHLTDLE